MRTRTPEERRASAKKAHASRRANKEMEAQRERDRQFYAGKLGAEIAAMEAQLARAKKFVDIRKYASVAGGALLRDKEIVAAAVPFTPFCGVYFLVCGSEVVYVGQSVNVHQRIYQHHNAELILFDSFAYQPCSQESLNTLESLYIHYLRPMRNGAPPLKLEVMAKIFEEKTK